MGIKENNNNEDNKRKLEENIIIGTIKVEKNNLKQRIINSYENAKRENPKYWDWDNMKVNENEEEIKNCEIFINEKKIIFSYYYNFPDEGDYIIKYKFNKLIRFTNYMFYGCRSLISLDLSNFNTQNVTDMGYMFYDCNSLISLDLSNFCTQNVNDMESMFSHCNSLTSLNLSNFNTQTITDMESILSHCNSLIIRFIRY